MAIGFGQQTITQPGGSIGNTDDLKRIELLRDKIQSMEGSLKESDLKELRKELLDLEMRTQGEKPLEHADFEERSSLIWSNFKYVVWSFVNIVWWLVCFNGILAILTLPKRKTEYIFNEISVQTDRIYKGFMDSMVHNVDDSDKRSIRSSFKRYVLILMGMLWSTLYPALVTGLTFIFMFRRSLTSFILTLLIMALFRVILPLQTSEVVFWYVWRILEVVSFFSTAFILARPIPPKTIS